MEIFEVLDRIEIKIGSLGPRSDYAIRRRVIKGKFSRFFAWKILFSLVIRFRTR